MIEKSEKQEQAEFLRWFGEMFPEHKILSIPNGRQCKPKVVIQLKNDGMSPGFPDLEIPFLSLYIEMKKAKGGRLSADQKMWIDYLRSIGKRAEVAKGAEEAKRIVLDQMERLRGLNEI